jgi:hypothetical protein
MQRALPFKLKNSADLSTGLSLCLFIFDTILDLVFAVEGRRVWSLLYVFETTTSKSLWQVGDALVTIGIVMCAATIAVACIAVPLWQLPRVPATVRATASWGSGLIIACMLAGHGLLITAVYTQVSGWEASLSTIHVIVIM